ncbi:hypothetical protein D3C71_2144120 [compost metagenome]
MVELSVVMCEKNEIKADDITFSSVKTTEVFLQEGKTLRQYTSDIIQHFLMRNNNDVKKTAKALDVGKSTIYKMLQAGELKLN